MRPCAARTLLGLAFLFAVQCMAQETSTNEQPIRTQLKVSLYPWVPEGESYVQWIEKDFESQNPSVDLVVRPLKKSQDWEPNEYVGDLSYEIDKAQVALTTQGPDTQDLVEIDTVILGALIDRKAVVPFNVSRSDYLPAAMEAVTLNGSVYGVPHWTCGYFVVSANPAIRKATNINELLAFLQGLKTDQVDLVGDFDGSWDSITIYLDAFKDSYAQGDLVKALSQNTLDSTVEGYFKLLAAACVKDGQNYCGKDGVDTFVAGQADALIGYSERLNSVLTHKDNKISDYHIASATLGGGDAPTLFTDALVMSPQCSTSECKDAAQKFATYYIDERVFEVVLMGLDAGATGKPRYLLPSTETAFGYGKVATDSIYKELKEEIAGAKSFPNSGVPEARDRGDIRKAIKAALGL